MRTICAKRLRYLFRDNGTQYDVEMIDLENATNLERRKERRRMPPTFVHVSAGSRPVYSVGISRETLYQYQRLTE